MPLPLPSLAAARGARAAVARDAICAPPTAGIEVASVAVLVGLIIADERSPYTRRRSVCSRGAPDGVKGQIVAFCSNRRRSASVRPTFGRLQLFSRSASLDPRYLRASGPLISDTSGAGETHAVLNTVDALLHDGSEPSSFIPHVTATRETARKEERTGAIRAHPREPPVWSKLQKNALQLLRRGARDPEARVPHLLGEHVRGERR